VKNDYILNQKIECLNELSHLVRVRPIRLEYEKLCSTTLEKE
jgi:hypothetical protein